MNTLLNAFIGRFRKNKVIPNTPEKKERPKQVFITDGLTNEQISEKLESMWNYTFGKAIHPETKHAMDSAKDVFAMDNIQNIKSSFYANQVIPEQQLLWYANQTFIGYQLCAMLAQNWLISKACLMPAEDAIRKGYDLTINDGTEVNPEMLDALRAYDVEYNLNKNLVEFLQFGRVFGIRIAMFKVDSSDPDYYFKPFNPDGIAPGSYKGISQIDPYWIAPQLDTDAAGNPSSIHFYEPTWWNIAGKLIHRTHLVIFRTEEVADVLKPVYLYGGIPIPQKIYSRVYAAERIANEAPMLALTKRTDVINIDNAQALANQPWNPQTNSSVTQRILQWVNLRDNYGIKTLGLDEKMQQFDTSLNDLDEVIMTQYQLVAAASNVPAVKLLGTSPKGFNTTGEYEEASYHETLESLRIKATPLIQRHHLLLIRSNIIPEFGGEIFDTCITWKPLDAMTTREMAEINKMKAETGQILITNGAIDGYDERERVISDPESGYTGMDIEKETESLNEQEGEKDNGTIESNRRNTEEM